MMLARSSFQFDSNEVFRNYFRLAISVRDERSGSAFILLFFVCGLLPVLITIFIVQEYGFKPIAFLLDVFSGEVESFSLLFPVLTLLSVFGIAYGAYLLSFREPRWDSKRWRARTELVFERLHAGPTPAPINIATIDKNGEYNPEKPRTLSMISPMTFLMPFVHLFVNIDNAPVYYDTIPWLYPRYPEPTGKPIEPVQFTAIFEKDRILKGSHGEVFVDSYKDILDIIENKRIPDLAILRARHTLNELVVKADELEGMQWNELKAYILKRKDEGTKLEVAARKLHDWL